MEEMRLIRRDCLDGCQLSGSRRAQYGISLMALEDAVQVAVTRSIAVRPPAVFATLADVTKWPATIGSIKQLELLTPGSIRVGTRIRAQRAMFGRVKTEELEIVEIVRSRRLRLAAESRGLQYERDHIIDAMQPGSRVTLIIRQS